MSSARRKWTPEEAAALRELYGAKRVAELASILHRSKPSILRKASKLGLRKNRKWTPGEIDMLRSLYRKKPLRVIATLLCRPESSITGRAKQLGLSLTREQFAGRPWSSDEDATLKEMYAVRPRAVVARKLNRTKNAITSRAGVLGLCKQHEEYWSPEHIRLLREKYATTPIAKLTAMFSRSEGSIHNKAKKLGLRKCDVDWYSDVNIAKFLSRRGMLCDGEFRRELMKHPKLLDLKRKQLQLNRAARSIRSGGAPV